MASSTHQLPRLIHILLLLRSICRTDIESKTFQVVAFLSAILLTIGINYGIGAHQYQLTAAQISEATKWSWMNQSVGIFATGTGKLALVAFLRQIHGPEHRRRVTFLWGVAISNLILNCITIGMIMTQCSPRDKLWIDSLEGTCNGRLRNQNMAYFQGSEYYTCTCPSSNFWLMFVDLDRLVGALRSYLGFVSHCLLLESATRSAREDRSLLLNGLGRDVQPTLLL